MSEANRAGESAAGHRDGGFDRPCVKVVALRQILGTSGLASWFKVTGEMTEARDQSGAGTSRFSAV